MSTRAVFEFHVYLSIPLDEDFTEEDARSGECHRMMEKALSSYLRKWPDYPKSCDCEVMDVTIERTPENPREKGDDDGVEYGHPDDKLRGLED